MNIQAAIADHILQGKTLTHFQSIRRWNYYKLASVVNRMRDKGFPVVTEMVTKNKKTFAKYSL